MDDRLIRDRFPRASRYHPEWVLAGVSGAANPLWMVEWLTEAIDLRPGMRVLDLGCGRALSSILLHREFGVQVWATDLWFSASENRQRIEDAGAADGVFPIHADARSLPFAPDFFDAVVSLDSYIYFGTDDHYLPYIARFLKPGATFAMAGACMLQEVEQVPSHLREWWTPDCWCLHSPTWWRRHWEKYGIVDVQTADSLPDGWRFWLDWLRLIAPENETEIAAVETDAGRYFGYYRVAARLREGVQLEEPVSSLTMEYKRTPLLRQME